MVLIISYFFFLYWSPSFLLCTIFDFISSNIDEVLSINPSANVLSLETLTPIITTGSYILVKLIQLVNSVIIFLSQITLLKWLTFLLGSLTVTLTVLLFWIYLFILIPVFVLQLLTLHSPLGNANHVVLSVSNDFLTNSKRDAPFYRIVMTILVLTGMVFVNIWEMFHGRISLNSVLLLLLVNFVSGFRLELMYISLTVSIRSSLTYLHGFQQLVLLP